MARSGWDLVWVAIEIAIVLGAVYFTSNFFLGTLVAFGLTMITALFGVPYFILAPKNMWFTFVREGTVKFVTRGGAFKKALIQWKGYTFDENYNIVPENTWIKDGKVVPEGTDGAKKYKEPWHPLGGFRFYGWFPADDIHVYKFRWTSVTERGEIRPREEYLDYILVKDDVYYHAYHVKDKGNIPIVLETYLTLSVSNPVKARFIVHNWLETVIDRAEPMMIQYSQGRYYETLLAQTQKIGEIIKKRLSQAKLIEEEFLGRYGINVRAIEVRRVVLPPDLEKATVAQRTAEYEAYATVTRAVAEAKRINTVYGGIKNFRGLGRLIRTLEAVEKSPLATSMTVQAVPGLAEIFKEVFRRPAPEDLTIKELREDIKKLTKEVKTLKTKKGVK
jgi:hypothetical protein